MTESIRDLTADPGSVDRVLNLVARRGMLPILQALASGSLGHNELARETQMDSKQLSRALCLAREASLVSRTVHSNHIPVRVRYRLTHRGEGLVRALVPLARWSEENHDHGRPDVPGDAGRPVPQDRRLSSSM
ncbi:helix-turn-helix transcriptional regulator [Microbispora sp. RL4-1S]|uniref:Helix-turn-helix transcriptional regulator n=1 Tax=Microbispora oryzae TaxID=2806554 RepID=A0A940WHZ0_9ACTN|nr:helix-turn-helix domain-containing protein [Microbispora oryzae]MBP2705871.1 helix-turn-helix transcriptional regulator [Microbispora oryzae]